MRVSRFFIEQSLRPHQQISLPSDLVHYVARVLRHKQGDQLILFNGIPFQQQMGEFSAHITAIEKHVVTVLIDDFIAKENESHLHITLLQGVSRGDRMDYTIQKAVELGVNRIIPVFTERSNTKLDTRRLEKKILHWQGIARNACEQSGRIQLVEIVSAIEFVQLQLFPADLNLLLAPDSRQSLSSLNGIQPDSANLLIGPEGGLTDKEIKLAVEMQNYQTVALGPRILRTETAGAAALSIVQYLWGDFK